ncbi:MAG: 3-methyl-2-oxobutanoate hydroxymethyltransferase [Chloroflexota bacterium]|nr:3-methyl-2-oxobutanoate hydroxymethyltransferase [Chloroflexota bacterium]
MAKPTIGELLAGKGKRQLTMTNATDYNTARAAGEAGIDIISGRGMYDEQQIGIVLDQIVKAAPDAVIACNLPATIAYVSDSEAIRAAMIARDHGADIIYSSGNTLSRFEAMADVGINCGGHVGLVPIRSSREGGIGARGKTLDQAIRIYEETVAYQNVGAVIVEMECVAAEIATEISKRVDILVMSLGSGPGCDGQFLFSADMLGFHEPRYPGMGKPYEGPLPRHAKRYINLFEEAKRGFATFKAEVDSGEFPSANHLIKADHSVVDAFRATADAPNRG